MSEDWAVTYPLFTKGENQIHSLDDLKQQYARTLNAFTVATNRITTCEKDMKELKIQMDILKKALDNGNRDSKSGP